MHGLAPVRRRHYAPTRALRYAAWQRCAVTPFGPAQGKLRQAQGGAQGARLGLLAGLCVAVHVILRREAPCHSEARSAEESLRRFFASQILRYAQNDRGEEEQTAPASDVGQRPYRRMFWSRAPAPSRYSGPPLQPVQEPASAGFQPVALDFSPAPHPFTPSSILPHPGGGSLPSVALDFGPALHPLSTPQSRARAKDSNVKATVPRSSKPSPVTR